MRGKVDAWIRRRRAFTGERHLIRSHIRILSLEEDEEEQGRIIQCILSFLRCGLGTNFLEMLDVAVPVCIPEIGQEGKLRIGHCVEVLRGKYSFYRNYG